MAPPDRLSELPDCLLQGILSSLRARQVVQTTALSRRWRDVWRGVLRLDIDQREFQAAEAAVDRDGRRDRSVELEEWARFDDFADNLLLHHGGGGGDDDDNLPLDALRLHVVDKRDSSRRRLPLYTRWLEWVHGCLDRYRPTALEIHSDFDVTVDLRLMGLRSDLSRLNTLRLTGVLHAGGFGDSDSADDSSVCPQLEHVEFTRCAIGFEGVVTARTLKKLVIERCWRRTDTKEEGAPRPRVQAPALTSLRLVMTFQSDIWVFETPSLVEASIRSRRSFTDRSDEYELLCNLYNVTKLELSGFLALEKIRPKNGDMPKFHNLTTLLLEDCDLNGEVYNMLDLFLYNAPKLEELTLQNCKLSQEWSESKKMCLNLKFTEINCQKKEDVRQVDH